jgi:hypothetical protein
MTGTGSRANTRSRTHAVAPPTAARKVKSRTVRRRHVVLRPEEGIVHTPPIIESDLKVFQVKYLRWFSLLCSKCGEEVPRMILLQVTERGHLRIFPLSRYDI